MRRHHVFSLLTLFSQMLFAGPTIVVRYLDGGQEFPLTRVANLGEIRSGTGLTLNLEPIGSEASPTLFLRTIQPELLAEKLRGLETVELEVSPARITRLPTQEAGAGEVSIGAVLLVQGEKRNTLTWTLVKARFSSAIDGLYNAFEIPDLADQKGTSCGVAVLTIQDILGRHRNF